MSPAFMNRRLMLAVDDTTILTITSDGAVSVETAAGQDNVTISIVKLVEIVQTVQTWWRS